MPGWGVKFVVLAGLASAASGQAPTLVFFDWGKPAVSGDAAAILDGVAADFLRAPEGHLALTGFADCSGGAASNRRSGLARAEAVRAYLAAHGVPASAISVASLGENQPLIPTADGVREPQNRRVEVRVER